jgi:hypothetical protein
MLSIDWTTVVVYAAIFFFGALPLAAGIVGMVHGISDAVQHHRRPPLFSILAWIVGILFLVGTLGCIVLENRFGLYLYIFGHFFDFWRLIFGGIITISILSGCSVFVFRSYCPAKGQRAATEDAEDEGEGEYQEPNHLAARILSIGLAVVLLLLVTVYLCYIDYYNFEHETTMYTAPDGQRTILIDNYYWMLRYESDWYRLENARIYQVRYGFFATKLYEKTENDITYIEADESSIIWTEEGFQIPFGKVYLTYDYYE